MRFTYGKTHTEQNKANLIPPPFLALQNNISMLPVAEQALCIEGMIDAAEREWWSLLAFKVSL